MNIAFIHHDKRIGTGAHYINDLMAAKLRERGVRVKHFYPRTTLIDSPNNLKGIANILFFYSLLEHKQEILRYSLIQGTTYTPLPFLAFSKPVVCHFGSTTRGFLDATPSANHIEQETKDIWYTLRRSDVIAELNTRTRRPLRDIADIEQYVASRAAAVIATSKSVRAQLMAEGVHAKRVSVIHNAIEDYWFDKPLASIKRAPRIVFLGRIGGDVFTLKLKGVDRLIHLFAKFPKTEKVAITMTTNKKLKTWMKDTLTRYTDFINFKKDLIPGVLRPLRGSILFLPSRYEGFSLSLVEGMSQGLIPVTYPVGVASEIIVNGYNGFLVKNQREAVARTRMLLANESLRARMSLHAFETSLQFRSTLQVSQLHSFYQSILHENQQNGLHKDI